MSGRLRFAYGLVCGISLALAVWHYGDGSMVLAAINLAITLVTAAVGLGDRTDANTGKAST